MEAERKLQVVESADISVCGGALSRVKSGFYVCTRCNLSIPTGRNLFLLAQGNTRQSNHATK